jgi:Spy/CpxP family protein refolding chaperone
MLGIRAKVTIRSGLSNIQWSYTMKKLHAVLAGLVAGTSLSVAVLAQAQPFGGMGPGSGPGMGMRGGPGMMVGVDPAAAADVRLANMKTTLKIETSQESHWQAFAAAAKQQSTAMAAMRAQMLQSTTAPDRMAVRTAMLQQQAAGQPAVANAFNALYTVLSPEQKAIADQGFGMMRGPGMRFGPRAG